MVVSTEVGEGFVIYSPGAEENNKIPGVFKSAEECFHRIGENKKEERVTVVL